MTARHSALIITTIALILLALVPAVSAYDYEETITDTTTGYTYPVSASSPTTALDRNFGQFGIRYIENCQDLVLIKTDPLQKTIKIPAGSQSFEVVFHIDSISGPVVGRGTYQTWHDPSPVCQVDFNEWDVSGYTGAHQIFMEKTEGTWASSEANVVHTMSDQEHLVMWQDRDDQWHRGRAILDVYYRQTFKHYYNVAESLGIYTVNVVKTIDGTPYGSTVYLYDGDNKLMIDPIHDTSSFTKRLTSAPITLNIKGGNLKWYNRTFYSDTGTPGDDPGDPSRVMVHIIAQDARNENLLLDAAVEVRDQYDAVVAAGTTSPEGWMVFEYDLPDTLTDEDFDRYYTVSVSLPGWTQKVTNFKFYPAFIPRSGDWIRVEMLPDTDGPADPEKTYIMFFVRDIHANPLERASIEIAGQYWHTNSAGHVAVEVPKNSTTAYTVRKTGHVSISGSAAVGAEGSYVVNIALGPALPDRTPGPGDDPGATPPPRDTRTNEEKGKAVIDLIADNAELIATLAILAAVMGLINLIMPGRRRR